MIVKIEIELKQKGRTMKCERSQKRNLIKVIQLRLCRDYTLAYAIDKTRGYPRKTLAELKVIAKDVLTTEDRSNR